jgi:glycosyltransferase involved in cell wall biosynthesis
MKVALIAHEGGGIASVSYGLAKNLSKRRICATIFTGTPHSTRRITKLSEYLEIVRLPILDFPPRAIWFQALNFKSLLKSLKSYDIIHCVSPDASFVLTFYRKQLGKPFVATIHGSPRASQKAFINQPISSWTVGDFGYHILEFPLHEFSVNAILERSDHISVCSFSVLDELKAYKSADFNKISVIYNGVDFDEIESVQSSLAEKEHELSIIFAGRLFWMKGVTFLLEAFKLVRKKFPKAHLSILGKGPLERRIKNYAADVGLKENVTYMGYLPHTKLIAETKRSDVVVFPSLYEAQSMFILEAMACRKPVVTFDLPVMHETISHGKNGLMAQTRNVKDLSEKICLLLSDEKLRLELGKNAYLYAKEKHDLVRQVDKYLKVYEEIGGDAPD